MKLLISRYHPTHHALASTKAVLIAIGLAAGFAAGVLVAAPRPAPVDHSAPGTYSTDAPPDDGIMGATPAGKTPEGKRITDGRFLE